MDLPLQGIHGAGPKVRRYRLREWRSIPLRWDISWESARFTRDEPVTRARSNFQLATENLLASRRMNLPRANYSSLGAIVAKTRHKSPPPFSFAISRSKS